MKTVPEVNWNWSPLEKSNAVEATYESTHTEF
jgi:hypothetical protein